MRDALAKDLKTDNWIRMLAVMTYNVGFLIAVMGSVLVGELMFGRYTDGSPRLAEAACHS
jgi:hypothetical protein